jgi:hypothetical protein
MSVFPTGRLTSGWRRGLDGGDPLESGGALARPIRGQIFLIDESDLDRLSRGTLSRPSGLVSRH